MTTTTLTYDDLGLTPQAVYEQMGYGDADPGGDVAHETRLVMSEIRPLLRPRLGFRLAAGCLSADGATLIAGGSEFAVGRVIGRQLRGMSAVAIFVATAGMEFEDYQRRLEREGDMVRVFIADAVGSVIAELTADVMERMLAGEVAARGWTMTNRFSPGYCGWHVSQQQRLFPLLGDGDPCGVRLTDSSLMVPIKSVSGVIGLGQAVRRLDYPCGLCDLKSCYKRRKKA